MTSRTSVVEPGKKGAAKFTAADASALLEDATTVRQDKMNAQGGHFQFQLKPNIGGGQARLFLNQGFVTSQQC